MAITVHFDLYGPLRDAVGRKRVTASVGEESTVGDGFSALCESHPNLESHLGPDELGTGGLTITVDGRNVQQLDGVETSLTDGAVVRIAPQVVGG